MPRIKILTGCSRLVGIKPVRLLELWGEWEEAKFLRGVRVIRAKKAAPEVTNTSAIIPQKNGCCNRLNRGVLFFCVTSHLHTLKKLTATMGHRSSWTQW